MDPQTQTQNPSRGEAERLLGISEKLLLTRDLTGAREFALLAQETEPLLEGSDQILAITDVLLASEKRVGPTNNPSSHHDWYGILQTQPQSLSSEPDLLKKNYRRLALLLHPDKNKFHHSEAAFKLVADAWSVLSDPNKRTPYNRDLNLNIFEKVDLSSRPPPPPPQQHQQQSDKLPVRRSARERQQQQQQQYNNSNKGKGKSGGGDRGVSFWTACPYCYVLYEYARVYEECVIKCQNCTRGFHAARIPKLPPVVPGKEAYYACWGFFPIGFSAAKEKGKEKEKEKEKGGNDNNVDVNNNNGGGGFPNWVPGMFGGNVNANINNNNNAAASSQQVGVSGTKKRGRPRKNPIM